MQGNDRLCGRTVPHAGGDLPIIPPQLLKLANVATSSYIDHPVTTVGVRVLKNRLSEYLRRVKAGERIVVTERGVPVAELRPPESSAPGGHLSKLDRLRAQGSIRPRLRDDPFVDWPDIKLPPGTAAALIDEDRDDEPDNY